MLGYTISPEGPAKLNPCISITLSGIAKGLFVCNLSTQLSTEETWHINVCRG